jgi:hypothetical protein
MLVCGNVVVLNVAQALSKIQYVRRSAKLQFYECHEFNAWIVVGNQDAPVAKTAQMMLTKPTRMLRISYARTVGDPVAINTS